MEALLVHKNITKAQAMEKSVKALKEVGIHDAENRLNQYPHEFSGGMRQRVMIAMALVTEPQLLIADEPTTALDVTIQAQILDLIRKLQQEHNTAVIFITHDLGVIAGISDNVLVMYGGRIMEYGATATIYYNHQHPYTRALLDSIPATYNRGEELYSIPGQPPDVSKPIPGCVFAPRCEFADEKCHCTTPQLLKVSENHYSACLRAQQGTLQMDSVTMKGMVQ